MSTTVKANLEPVENVTSKVTVRTHQLVVDRGIAKGGSDRGPAGGEYLVVSLGGCFTSHLLAAAQTRQVHLGNLRVVAEGTMDGSPERFTPFVVALTAAPAAPAFPHNPAPLPCPPRHVVKP